MRKEQFSKMTVRLDLWSKSMTIENKIPTFKWKSKTASEPILGIILRIYSVEVKILEHKNDLKVRLVVKKYDNFKQIPTFKWKSNNTD